ncbi:cytochrome P450 [Novosphingobium pentaromativorans]|uniref:Cytochrome P450 n=1 Tax=Novosphingobium pentaromativorans US6-1 TaxID=1088721 RepID=G6EGH3_9SPHN|nr:cytochrome P450 [Novosphingobium pentaromativorans]EHJ59624.1 hypothetical protein NSU_3507 [Novosphingobium pentaromativorans US6-1]
MNDSDHAVLGQEFADYLARPWEVEDPPALFRRLRNVDPVFKGPGNTWFITGFRAADEAYRHPGLSRAASARQLVRPMGLAGVDPPAVVKVVDMMMTWIIHTDDPQHARLRQLAAPHFMPKAVKAWQDRVEMLVDGLLDQLEESDSFDFLEEFAYPVPIHMILSILGVPFEDHQLLLEWVNRSSGINTVVGGTAQDIKRSAQEALVEEAEYFRRLIAQRRLAPGNDLIDALIAAEEDGDRMTQDELVGMVMLVLGAGLHTTAHLIANTMLCLLSNPDQQALVRANPGLARKAVEETLRFDPSSAGQPRVAIEDLVIAGKQICAGEQVVIVLRAANRDPERFDEPDRYLIERNEGHHLGFGTGIHMCLGNWLARLEAVTAIERAIGRLDGLQLSTERLPRSRTQSRALEKLPLRRVRAAATL